MEANPEFLANMRAASHTEKTEWSRSLRRQEQWKERQSTGEFMFMLALRGAGFFPVPEFAVERFNIDFAFPDEMLAVELDPRWHRSRSKREIDTRKDQRLAELGWTVLRLDSRASNPFNVHRVSEALKSLAATQPR
jgi:very-short-patch-repair endonuclease